MALQLLQIDPATELERIEAEMARRSFARFVRRAWREIDPAPLVWGWHVDALCQHLQAVTEGRLRRIVINIPPGHAKSMIVSVLWPAWEWTRNPARQFLTASYEIGLATRDATKSRRLIASEWYQRHFTKPKPSDPEFMRWGLVSDQNVKSYYQNDSMGHRLAISVGGAGTGWRGDTLIIDDPINATDAHSKLARETAIRWKTETMSSRFNDMASASEVVIMQRLHEDDLSGHLLRGQGWDHLRLPSEFDTEPACECVSCKRGSTSIGWKDPRTVAGELLFPAKFPREVLDVAKTAGSGMGPLAYAGQHGQRPMPAAGGVLQKAWFFNRWRDESAAARVDIARPGDPTKNVRRFDPRKAKWRKVVIVTDAAFKDAAKNDKVAVGVWGVLAHAPDAYLLDLRWGNMDVTKTKEAILSLRKKWPMARQLWIEDKANGTAIIQILKKTVPGVVEIEPIGSKDARIAASADFWAAGNVWLPDDHAQINEFVQEAISFPKAAHDDAIDMSAYGILGLLNDGNLAALEALCKWGSG